jgi:formylglycine-generating enzyme required for sulfatase activity
MINILITNVLANNEKCFNEYRLEIGNGASMIFCEVPMNDSIPAFTKYKEKLKESIGNKRLFVSKHELTQKQYQTVMFDVKAPYINYKTGEPVRYVKLGMNHPAVYLTYADAIDFMTELSSLDKSAEYRLPTESEWEYAATGGEVTKFPWGDNYDPNMLHVNALERTSTVQDATICPSASTSMIKPNYCVNNFGLMHMLGNVIEMTTDKKTLAAFHEQRDIDPGWFDANDGKNNRDSSLKFRAKGFHFRTKEKDIKSRRLENIYPAFYSFDVFTLNKTGHELGLRVFRIVK